MELPLRAALLRWLATGPTPLTTLNLLAEEAPLAASPPWLGIVASAAVEWGAKEAPGREIRVALELHTRGDDPEGDGALVRAIDTRIEDFPRRHDGWQVASIAFLRSRAERRPRNLRAMLMEYRFRCLALA
ncbi:tail completion protein gp17 [Qipengyuania sp. YIM B01966]|uniref:tail completion protein gp17 n=1 Tax=Qipengyuania sp. YIM B01966 TaxID=2778646 RepID=UPI0018F710E6|nr:DUF3168 domain-containing protein [Qipengyuania sp. YIM B01966]